MSKYPRRGEFGDTRPNCSWCGKTFEELGSGYLGGRPYCSFECRMAGNYYLVICTVGILTIVSFLSTYVLPMMMVDMGLVSITVPIVLWVSAAYFWRGVILGYKVRNQ